MLIVVEDRYVHYFIELLFDIKALWGLDILQVDAPKGGLELGRNIDQLVWILRVDFDVEHIDVGEAFEEDRLPLHHRAGGLLQAMLPELLLVGGSRAQGRLFGQLAAWAAHQRPGGPPKAEHLKPSLKPCFFPLHPIYTASQLCMFNCRFRKPAITADQPIEILVILLAELSLQGTLQ